MNAITAFALTDTCRDIILMAMWIWRDILVTMLAAEIITKSKVRYILRDIRMTIGDTLYGELLDLSAIPRHNESVIGILPPSPRGH